MNASLDLLHRLTSSTVGIETRIPEDHPSAAVLGTERQGTGVVLDRGSLIFTVHYVTLGATSVSITTSSGDCHRGRVVAQDFATGVALLSTVGELGEGLSPRHSSDISAGREVVIVASTGAQERRVNDGMISAIGPFDATWEFSLDRALATTAQSPGFGGAPICDLEGRVVGITFLDAGEVGRFTLGIPVDHIIDHQAELLEHGRRVTRAARAWIGCFFYTVRNHVVIAGALPGGPGAIAGLKPGDVLLAVNRVEVHDRRDLYDNLWALTPGTSIELRLYRDNGMRSVFVRAANAEEFFS